jgi:hypothetical protein
VWRLPGSGNLRDFMLTTFCSCKLKETRAIALIFEVCLSKIFLHTKVLDIMYRLTEQEKKKMTLEWLKK